MDEEQMYNEGYDKGFNDGLEDGHDEGFNDGYNEAIDDIIAIIQNHEQMNLSTSDLITNILTEIDGLRKI